MNAPALPAPRRPGRYRIATVCLGNICRSPVAAAVLRERVAAAGLRGVEVVSAGTGAWHVGDGMDRRAAATLIDAGYDATHRARQIPESWLADCDLLLAMDTDNLRDIGGLGDIEEGRLLLFRAFDPVDPGGDVPDPYFGGPAGFATVLEMVERTCDVIVEELRSVAAPA